VVAGVFGSQAVCDYYRQKAVRLAAESGPPETRPAPGVEPQSP